MNSLIKCENRLKNIIVSDKRENPCRIEKILKSELINIVKNYFEICSDEVDLSILIRDDGRYSIQLNVLSRSIKFANSFDSYS